MAAVLRCCELGNTHYFFRSVLKRVNYVPSITPSRSLSTENKNKNKSSNSKYSKTVVLPRTQFPLWLDSRRRVEHDTNILKTCGFSTVYQWQRHNLAEKEFVLHDGPPYANGDPHVGHAVNKVLKDIVIRYKMITGHRIHYVPGWDCHGLPIELKAVSSTEGDGILTPIEIRNKARKFAKDTILKQKEVFRSWGILGDWNSECYHTYDRSYVQNQLHQFYKMYEKGLIYRDMKPVYWSPSSRTALAEAELEYNKDHISCCVTLRVQLNTLPASVTCNETLYALVWTTTPWTLPANEAIAYNSDIEYSVVRIEGYNGQYILASNLVSMLQEQLSRNIEVVQNITGNSLNSATYKHPFCHDKIHGFFNADHVTDSKGTGLVHSAPAHGREDYLLGVANKLPVVSMVSEDGTYSAAAGQELEGKSIFTDGVSKVLQILSSDVIHKDELVHSYPYDWRTKQPIIMLASKQWFFNCHAVKDAAIEELKHVSVLPLDRNGRDTLIKLVKKRPFWCISRQRVWGVPIPVLFERGSASPVISKSLIEHYCTLIDQHGTDFWWNLPVEELCPPELAADLNVSVSELVKGTDILDIWFDSGLSWSAALENRTADLYLEGIDQCTGWFQSSLLTSVALKQKAPYRMIFTHGFVVDGCGQKMSKSLGNVINPQDITCGGKQRDEQPAYGVDTLRWWVAAHSVQHASIPVSFPIVKLCAENVHKIRSVMRYALGVLADFSAHKHLEEKPTFLLDQYMLHKIQAVNKDVQKYYDEFKFNFVTSSIMNFVVNDVSAFYYTLTKDRLYCDPVGSVDRRACQFVMFHLLEFLLHSISPVTPLLAEEVYLHHPCFREREQYFKHRSQSLLVIPEEWHQPWVEGVMDGALKVRDALNQSHGMSGTWGYNCTIQALPDMVNLLQPLVDGQSATHSQLAEILQVASVRIEPLEDHKLRNCDPFHFELALTPTNTVVCARCRRHTVLHECDVCQRCWDIVNGKEGAGGVSG